MIELTIAAAVFLVVVGTIFIAVGGNNNYRALHNTSVILQADLRYAQRRAIMEGQRVGIVFEPARNRYQIISLNPLNIIRTVYFRNGVQLVSINYPNNRVMYLPRGTAIPGSILLRNGQYWQRITTTLGGGQARLHPIVTEEPIWN